MSGIFHSFLCGQCFVKVQSLYQIISHSILSTDLRWGLRAGIIPLCHRWADRDLERVAVCPRSEGHQVSEPSQNSRHTPSRTLSIASPSDCFKRIIYPSVVSHSNLLLSLSFFIPCFRLQRVGFQEGVMEAKFTVRSKISK